MTTIDRLTELEQVDEHDLFIVYDSSRTRTISAKNLKKYITESGFDPDAFISGRIDQVNELLYMTNRAKEEILIGPVISTLTIHDIQELQNVPPLEAGKIFKVNSSGDRVIFESPFDLSDHYIQELANVPPLQPFAFLRCSADGSNTEWITSSGSEVGIADDGVNKGNAHTLNFEGGIVATVTNNIAAISFNDETGFVTLDTEQIITAIKTFQELQKFQHGIYITTQSTGTKGLSILDDGGKTEFMATDTETPDTLPSFHVSHDGKAAFHKFLSVYNGDLMKELQVKSEANHTEFIMSWDGAEKVAIHITKGGVCSFPNTPFPWSDEGAYLGSNWRICRDGELTFNAGLHTNEDASQDRFRYRIDSGVLKLDATSDPATVWHNALEVQEDGSTTYHKPLNVDSELRIMPDIGFLAFDTLSQIDAYRLYCLGGDDLILDIAGVGAALSVNADDKSVGLYYGGVEVARSTEGGIDLPPNNPFGALKGVRLGNHTSSEHTRFALQQLTSAGVYEKDWVACGVDGGVSLYHNGLLCIKTISSLEASIGNTVLASYPQGDNGYWRFRANNDTAASYMVGGIDSASLHGTWYGSVTPSSSVIKDNLTPVDGLSKICQLEPFEYTYKTTKDADNEPVFHVGFTAESFEQVFPDQVEEVTQEQLDEFKIDTSDTSTPIKGIKKDITGFDMDAYLVDAIKSLKAQNDQLLETNAKMLQRIEALENQVNPAGGVH